MSEYKFKKGDRVRVVESSELDPESLKVGSTGTVNENNSDCPMVIFDDDSWLEGLEEDYEYPMYEHQLELIEEAEQQNAEQEYDFINPKHYKNSSKEVWEMMVDIWGVEKFIAYCEISAFKYRMRAGNKPEQPIERDLEKAKWYESKANELRKQIEE